MPSDLLLLMKVIIGHPPTHLSHPECLLSSPPASLLTVWSLPAAAHVTLDVHLLNAIQSEKNVVSSHVVGDPLDTPDPWQIQRCGHRKQGCHSQAPIKGPCLKSQQDESDGPSQGLAKTSGISCTESGCKGVDYGGHGWGWARLAKK